MQWYPSDVEADEAVKLMNNREFGCYVKLLGHNWIEGSIPKDLETLAVIVREDPRDFDGIWAKIKAKFRVKNSRIPDRLTNNRVEMERMKQRAYSKKQRENAKQSHKKHKSAVDGKISQAKATAPKWHDSGSALQSSSSTSSSTSVLKQTTDENPPSPGVSPKLTPLQRLVRFYKHLLGVGKDNAEWDRANFAKYGPQAKEFLGYFNEGAQEHDVKDALRALRQIYRKITSSKTKDGQQLSLSIIGATRHIAEWRLNRGKYDANDQPE